VGWRTGFLVAPVAAVIALVIHLRFVPETPRTPRRLDVPGLTLVAIALLALVYGISQLQRGLHPGAMIAIAMGVVAGAGFLMRERFTPDPALDLRVFRSGRFNAAVTAGVTFNCSASIGPRRRPGELRSQRSQGHTDRRLLALDPTNPVQKCGELIADTRPPAFVFVESVWGQEGMLDGHECLIVAEWLEGDVDDTDRCRVQPVRGAPREAQHMGAIDGQEASGDQNAGARIVDVELHASPDAGLDGEGDNPDRTRTHPLRQ
jgi:hypothetical protein